MFDQCLVCLHYKYSVSNLFFFIRRYQFIQEAECVSNLMDYCIMALKQTEEELNSSGQQLEKQQQTMVDNPVSYGRPDTVSTLEALQMVTQSLKQNFDEMTNIILQIIETCTAPLVFSRTTDELTRKDALRTIINTLCRVMNLYGVHAEKIKTFAAKCIHVIMKRSADEDIVESVVVKSDLVDVLVEEIREAVKMEKPSPELLELLMLLVRDVSVIQGCIIALVDGPGILEIVSLLEKMDHRDSTMSLIVDILWNVLEAYDHSKEVLGCEWVIQVIHSCLLKLLNHGHRNRDQELANDVLVVRINIHLYCFRQLY